MSREAGVKVHSFGTIGVFALGLGLLAGCAGNQTLSETFDSSNRPQMLMPGASRSDVKGLAMGAARAKGWTIVKSTDDLLVVQRPLDPASSTALALGTANSASPAVIEVTSAFMEQSGGVKVALGAVLVNQAPGEKAPKRIDYTENYRDALNQSLESLRSNWTSNRQRVASAMPSQPSRSETPPANTTESSTGASNDNPLVKVWGETVAEETAAKRDPASSISALPTSPATRSAAGAPVPRGLSPRLP